MKNAGYLTLGALALWVLVYIPGRMFAGETAAVQSLAALGLTFVPAMATLVWASWASRNSPETYAFAVLGGSMVRMFLALGGAWGLSQAMPHWFDTNLWIFLIVFYLGILGLEIGLLIRKLQPSPSPSPEAQRSEPPG